MTVLEIIEAALKEMDADGLVSHGECGCPINSLAPCGDMGMLCEAARRYRRIDGAKVETDAAGEVDYAYWPINSPPDAGEFERVKEVTE